VPLRAPDAEAWMAGRLGWRNGGVALDEPADLEHFAALVAAATRPIDDHRGSATYRRHAVGVMAARCLRGALSAEVR
jgi:CO/xanthine dehydrogenase FAD-binding subunit